MIDGDTLKYRRFTRTLNDPGKLIPITESPYKHTTDNVDYYTSLYNYNEKHYQQFKATGTISGIEDVTTSRLVFDFDETLEKGITLENARQSAIKLSERLLSYGVQEDSIQIFFSGSKGYHVEVDTDKVFTPAEFKSIVFNLAKDLPGFDTRIRNASRILRLALTRHQVSGLYKKPLTLAYLKHATEQQIKEFSSDVNDISPEDLEGHWTKAKITPDLLALKTFKEVVKKEPVEIKELDLSQRPNWLSKCKYALSQGFFKSGMRNDSLICLAATYKAQGLPEDVVAGMVHGVATLQSKRNDEEPHSESKIHTLVKSVFKDTWLGGTYSCKTDGWLHDYCQEHGLNCGEEELNQPSFRNIDDILNNYEKYMEDIDDNTIKTGIEDLDKEVRLQTSTVVGILGSPSSGKTTVALKMLRELNKTGRRGAFYSLDMGEPLIGQKFIQAVSNVSSEDLDRIFATTPRNLNKQLAHNLITKDEHTERMALVPEYQKKIRHWKSLVKEQANNLDVSFKSAITVEQIKRDLLLQQEKTGQKVWLVMVDYAECLSGPYADSVANMNMVFQKLKDIANELQTCVVILLQPNKFAGDPGEPITSYRQIKGASGIEQSCRVIIGIHREGYNPERQDEDKFITLTVLKNNMGKLAKIEAGFNGERGEIYKIGQAEKAILNKLKERKAQSRATEDEF